MRIAMDLDALNESALLRERFAPVADALIDASTDGLQFVPFASESTGAADPADLPVAARDLHRRAALLATGASVLLRFAPHPLPVLPASIVQSIAPNQRLAVAYPAETMALKDVPATDADRFFNIAVPTDRETAADAAAVIIAALRQNVAEQGAPPGDFAFRHVYGSGRAPGEKRRAALVAPFPPLQSGVADYSVEIMEPLMAHYGLDLYTSDGYKPVLPPGYTALGHAALERALRAPRTQRPYDLLIYQFGNNPHYHADMYGLLRRFAGISVLHDYVLFDLVYSIQGTRPNLGILFQDELTHHAGKSYSDEKVAKLSAGQMQPLDLVAEGTYMTRRLFTRSLGVIVHNEWSYEMAIKHHAKDNPLITMIPPVMPAVPLDDTPASIAALRRKYGVPVDAFVIAPCGIITKTKRPMQTLDAFRALLAERPDAHLLFVGSVNNADLELGFDFDQEVARRGLTDKITVTGYVDVPTFNEYLRLSDVCVTLRYPSQGETSGALLRMLVHAKASIVTDIGSFGNFPDDTVHKLKVPEGMKNDDEVAMILAAFRRMATDGDYRRDLGARGAAYIHREHSPERCARLYAEFGETVLRHPATPAKLAADWTARELARRASDDSSLAALDPAALFAGLSRSLAAVASTLHGES